MRLRFRGPGGASTATLADDATVGDLLSQITEKTGLPNFDIKYSYPPKPLDLPRSEPSTLLSKLDTKLDGEQLTISARDPPAGIAAVEQKQTPTESQAPKPVQTTSFSSVVPGASKSTPTKTAPPISLQRKGMSGEVPELPLPDRGATMVLRVMPDDNSCLFRAFGTAVLPTGDDASMPELRSLVATYIQADPETYSKVVLEQNPDDYCRWIQTSDAWGGFIEMGILSKHFEIEICSIDVQSLRVDKFNEGAPTRCILVYSGIHYDTIVQSPSEPPHTRADSPPEFDKRVWNTDDDVILITALELCKRLQAKHYYTDTGGMAIRCNECGVVIYGEKQASGHATQTGHYDMNEVIT